MSETLTLTAGQIFTGGTSLTGNDTGMIALTEVGSVSFNMLTTPPTINTVTVTEDAAASTLSYDTAVIQAVTIESVNPDTLVTLTTLDLPPGITAPAGALPVTVDATVLDVSVQTNYGNFVGTAAVVGTDGLLTLVAVQDIVVFGNTIDVGAAILSSGVQSTGTVDDIFTPAWTIPPCFAAGTRIRTQAGDVPVEELRADDLLSLAGGGTAPVVWLGCRRLDCRRHPRPWDVLPVRIAADAFGPGRPRRDLLLSPDHAVFVDSVLIPIRYLVNDATIRQEPADEVTYWHVELPTHNVVFAEGLPAESYLDTGNRSTFANGGGVTMLQPDFALRVWEAESCARLVLNGAELVAVRSFLLERAEKLGHAVTRDPALRLCVDGRLLRPTITGRTHRFGLPAKAKSIRLLSRSSAPAHVRDDSDDCRRLGVAVSRIVLDGKPIALSDARLGSGWHDIEQNGPEPGWRWTNGDAGLLLPGGSHLGIDVAMTERYWIRREDRRQQVA